MFISKKRLDRMIMDIYDLKMTVEALKSCHHVIEYPFCHGDHVDILHNQETVNTKQINNLSLSELAKYVMDGTPIKRESTVKVTKIFE